MTVDIIIKNGRLALATGLTEASLIIDGGKIAGIMRSGERQTE